MQAFALVFGLIFVVALVAAVLGLVASIVLTVVLAVMTARRGSWIPLIYNVRSLTRRKVTTLVTMLGMALVVGVFSTVLMLRNGIRETLVTAGNADNVIVLRKGSTAEITSAVDREQAKLLSSRDEVMLDPKDGKPMVDPQLAVLIFAQKSGGGPDDGSNVFVRGASDRTLSLHPIVKVMEGRWFAPGTSEIVIGRSLVGKFEGARLGSQMNFARRSWTVVGVLDAQGSSFDSEIWGDVEQMIPAFQRTMYSQLTMRLKDPSRIPGMADAVGLDPRLNLDVKQETKYFAELSSNLAGLLSFLGLFVAIVFSLGATLGAMISMYAQVAARIREVGTLRAIGFHRGSVLVSFVIESLILGIVAGVIGVAVSSLAQLGSFSTINFGTFSEVTFRFKLTGDVIGKSLFFGAMMGYAGGLLPAVRAARTPIIEATRGA